MLLKGKIVPGPMRGEGLVEHLYYRIVHTLGFEPYKGTLNVKVEHKFNMEMHATKIIDHVLLDGTRMIDAYVCPVMIKKGSESMKAWIIRKPKDIHSKDIVELISKERIKDEMHLKDGDEIELELHEGKIKKSDRRKELALRFRRKKYDIPHMLSGDTTLMKR